MSAAPEPMFDARLERLRSWSMDEAHVVQSARQHEPQYPNPAELRADVRKLLARYDAVCLYRARVEGRAGDTAAPKPPRNPGIREP